MNIKKMLIYRNSFYISLFAMVLWMCIYTALIEVIYGHTQDIAGWSKGGVLIILSFYYFITSIANFLFRDNFEQFGNKMRKGELDQYLTKPGSFQVQCFFANMRFDQLGAPFIVVFLFIYGVSQLDHQVIVSDIALGLVYAGISVVFFYHFLLLVATVTFYLEKAETLGSVMWNLSQVGRYPRQIFTGIAYSFFHFIFPMALITSIPSERFLGIEGGTMHILYFVIIISFCTISQLFFHVGLKKYSSAN